MARRQRRNRFPIVQLPPQGSLAPYSPGAVMPTPMPLGPPPMQSPSPDAGTGLPGGYVPMPDVSGMAGDRSPLDGLFPVYDQMVNGYPDIMPPGNPPSPMDPGVQSPYMPGPPAGDASAIPPGPPPDPYQLRSMPSYMPGTPPDSIPFDQNYPTYPTMRSPHLSKGEAIGAGIVTLLAGLAHSPDPGAAARGLMGVRTDQAAQQSQQDYGKYVGDVNEYKAGMNKNDAANTEQNRLFNAQEQRNLGAFRTEQQGVIAANREMIDQKKADIKKQADEVDQQRKQAEYKLRVRKQEGADQAEIDKREKNIADIKLKQTDLKAKNDHWHNQEIQNARGLDIKEYQGQTGRINSDIARTNSNTKIYAAQTGRMNVTALTGADAPIPGLTPAQAVSHKMQLDQRINAIGVALQQQVPDPTDPSGNRTVPRIAGPMRDKLQAEYNNHNKESAAWLAYYDSQRRRAAASQVAPPSGGGDDLSDAKKSELIGTATKFRQKMGRYPTRNEWVNLLGQTYNSRRLGELWDARIKGRK